MRAIALSSPSFPDWMSPGAADFIRASLQRNPARRASAMQLLQHRWISTHTCGRLGVGVNVSLGACEVRAWAQACVHVNPPLADMRAFVSAAVARAARHAGRMSLEGRLSVLRAWHALSRAGWMALARPMPLSLAADGW